MSEPSKSRAPPPSSRAPKSRSSTSDSEDDKPTSSRAPPPSSRAPSTVIGSSRYPGGVPPSSRAPPPSSQVQATMLQGRDSPQVVPGTMLQGRDSPRVVPGTMLQGRDGPPPGTPTLKPSILASVAPPTVIASVFITAEDLERALKQTQIEDLDDDDREKQEEWAQEQISKTTNCPEGWAFKRVPYQGYQCEMGGHGISDHLLAEGKGGILAIRKKADSKITREEMWESMDGPWYPNPEGEGYIAGVLAKKK